MLRLQENKTAQSHAHSNCTRLRTEKSHSSLVEKRPPPSMLRLCFLKTALRHLFWNTLYNTPQASLCIWMSFKRRFGYPRYMFDICKLTVLFSIIMFSVISLWKSSWKFFPSKLKFLMRETIPQNYFQINIFTTSLNI